MKHVLCGLMFFQSAYALANRGEHAKTKHDQRRLLSIL